MAGSTSGASQRSTAVVRKHSKTTAGRVPLRGPGFHAAHRAAARPGPPGFNPSRLRPVPVLRAPLGLRTCGAARFACATSLPLVTAGPRG
jgi:hypothetical protein